LPIRAALPVAPALEICGPELLSASPDLPNLLNQSITTAPLAATPAHSRTTMSRLGSAYRLLSLPTCCRHYPGGPGGSNCSGASDSPAESNGGGLPLEVAGSAAAMVVSGPARRSRLPLWASLRPAGSLNRQLATLLHRKLRPIRYLLSRFHCYRAEQSTSRAGLTPAGEQHLLHGARLPTPTGRTMEKMEAAINVQRSSFRV